MHSQRKAKTSFNFVTFTLFKRLFSFLWSFLGSKNRSRSGSCRLATIFCIHFYIFFPDTFLCGWLAGRKIEQNSSSSGLKLTDFGKNVCRELSLIPIFRDRLLLLGLSGLDWLTWLELRNVETNAKRKYNKTFKSPAVPFILVLPIILVNITCVVFQCTFLEELAPLYLTFVFRKFIKAPKSSNSLNK